MVSGGERMIESGSFGSAPASSDLMQMYRWMVLTRAFEERVEQLWLDGRLLESPHGSQGQEAIGVGACYGLRPTDLVMPSLRSRAAFFVRGVPVRTLLAGMYGKATGPARGKAVPHHMGDPDHGVLLGSGVVGASIPVAVGAALGLQMQGRDDVVLDFFGDGAAQRGDFHEGLNFAGVFRLPVVFVLENNGYAEMTPVRKHFAGPNFACRAEGYGFSGTSIDGNDVLTVYKAVQAAITVARSGKGPTLIECMTYRQRGHSGGHSPTELRDPNEVAVWLARDPIRRFESLLAFEGSHESGSARGDPQ